MRSLVNSVFCAAMLLASGSVQSGERVVTLRADEWCPFNCTPGDASPGYMIEIAVEALGAAGYRVDYATLNWVRSIQEARSGHIDAIVGATREEAPDFVFPHPLGTTVDALAVRNDTKLDLSAPDPFDDFVVGAIRGYDYTGKIGRYLASNERDGSRVQLTSGDDALATNLHKLVAGRVDIVVDNENRMRHVLRELGLDQRVTVITDGDPVPLYIAFSPANADSAKIAATLDDGVAELRRSGRLATILDHYGLVDWEGSR